MNCKKCGGINLGGNRCPICLEEYTKEQIWAFNNIDIPLASLLDSKGELSNFKKGVGINNDKGYRKLKEEGTINEEIENRKEVSTRESPNPIMYNAVESIKKDNSNYNKNNNINTNDSGNISKPSKQKEANSYQKLELKDIIICFSLGLNVLLGISLMILAVTHG